MKNKKAKMQNGARVHRSVTMNTEADDCGEMSDLDLPEEIKAQSSESREELQKALRISKRFLYKKEDIVEDISASDSEDENATASGDNDAESSDEEEGKFPDVESECKCYTSHLIVDIKT